MTSRLLTNVEVSRQICKQIILSNTILANAVVDNRNPAAHFGCVRVQYPDGSIIPHHNGHISCTSDVFRMQQCPEDSSLISCEDSHYTYLLYTRGFNIKCSPDMLSLYSSL